MALTDRSDYPAIGVATEEEIIDLWVQKRWVAQDSFHRPFIRQVEDSLRMVAGRHWDVFIESESRFVDVSRWMDEDERKWRQRPVFNWIGYWYMITHAKLTENPPVLTWMPASPDRSDSILASVMDPIFKYLWDVIGMNEKMDTLARWDVACGSGIIKSFWDPDAGSVMDAIGPAMVPMLDQQGIPMLNEMGMPQEQMVPGVPYQFASGSENEPVPMIEPLPGGQYQVTGDPARIPRGQINVHILNPLSVRSSREPVPHWEKQWDVERTVMHVDEIKERWGVEVEPEKGVGEDSTLDEILFGLGNVGASRQAIAANFTGQKERDGFAVIYEGWERPRDGADDGRHTVMTRTKLLEDGPNPISPNFRPYQKVDFIALPDRPMGKTPVEDLGPINRAYNRGWGQILEHRNLMTNPKWIVDSLSGINEITNRPGEVLTALKRPGVHALEAVQPPQLPQVVYEIQSMLKSEMQDIGSLRSGSEGRSPTYEASGELVKELRFNDDRYIGPAGRRFVDGIARMAYQWQELLKFGWDDEQMIRVAGESNAARFITVRPDMFQGRIHVKGVAESMLPEGRGERQQRLDFWLSAGLISPRQYFDMFNHPHLGRAARPGGVDATMAESEHSQMLRGMFVMPIEPHDDAVHIELHREFMAAPEFMELDPNVQAMFFQHQQLHEQQQLQKLMRDQALAMALGVEEQAEGEEPSPAGGESAGPEQAGTEEV